MHGSNDEDTAEYLPRVTEAETRRPQTASSQVRAEVGALSHPGRVRPNNEDSFLAARFARSMVTLTTNLPLNQVPDRYEEAGFALVVADGMGGQAAGEVASGLALTVGLNLVLNTPKWNLVMNPEEAREHIEKMYRRFRQIDRVLTERAEADPHLAGMGTTLTVACSAGTDLFLYHVGDSRAYLFRQGRLHQLTQDHTLAQELADAGQIHPAEMASHRLRHVLTRDVGGGHGNLEVDFQHLRLADGDRLLLCTNGLTDMVPDPLIAEVLRGTEPPQEASRALVELALERGGEDDVTVVLARYSIPGELCPPSPEAPPAG
jgi:serine/threonine protein phosphatase PrpC